MKKRIAIADFSAGALKENTRVYISEDENGEIEKIVGFEIVKSRGTSKQRPYVRFHSGVRYDRRRCTFNGRRAWLFEVDDDFLRDICTLWMASEAMPLDPDRVRGWRRGFDASAENFL